MNTGAQTWLSMLCPNNLAYFFVFSRGILYSSKNTTVPLHASLSKQISQQKSNNFTMRVIFANSFEFVRSHSKFFCTICLCASEVRVGCGVTGGASVVLFLVIVRLCMIYNV